MFHKKIPQKVWQFEGEKVDKWMSKNQKILQLWKLKIRLKIICYKRFLHVQYTSSDKMYFRFIVDYHANFEQK